jgi:glycosyltransferase involved in cell wall biosynthesis
MISVYFRKGRHPFYDELFNYPPEDVVYHEAKYITTHGKSLDSPIPRIKKLLYKKYLDITRAPNVIPLKVKEDLIYSSGGLMIKSSKPWVTDIEQGYALIGYRQQDRHLHTIIRRTKKLIRQQKCKILPWSYAAKKSLENLLGTKKFEEKIEVVYPAMHFEKFKKKKKETDSINFLYINRNFYGKAGLETLLAFDNLSKKYDLTMTFLSNTPPEIRKKFEQNKKITFIESPLPRHMTLELYKKADIFILPTLFDCFGFAFLEAMAYHLPIIATDIFAVPEIVEDEKNGLLVSPEVQLYNDRYLFKFPNTQTLYDYVKRHPLEKLQKQLEEKMEILIQDRKKRILLGKNGRKEVEKGKFSIKYRNYKLKNVYEELLKN